MINQINISSTRNKSRKNTERQQNENPNSQDKPQLHMSDIKIFENTDSKINLDSKHNKINSLTNNTSNNQSHEITMKINQGHEIIDIIEKNILDERKEFISGTTGNASVNEFLKVNSNVNNNVINNNNFNINNSTDNNSPNIEEYNSRDNLNKKVLVKIPRKGRSIGDYLQNLKK